jgi:hypothetical protein
VTTPLAARMGAAPPTAIDPAITGLAATLAAEAGAVAVLFYGSNLRTGSLDGVLDFYVLLPGKAERGLWPRVSYREVPSGSLILRAKIATMTLAMFERAARGRTLDTTIWARFVQPSALVWARNAAAAKAVHAALADAACTAARLAAALGPPRGTEAAFWRALFRATYQAEFRVEPAGREESILAANRAHFDGLLPLALSAQGIAFDQAGQTFAPRLEHATRRAIGRWWALRRRVGKALNLSRLAKATTTFDGAMRYVAWKVERHTGHAVRVTPMRERFPLLAAPAILRTLWQARRG